ncbi:hypothetical protein PENARI_c017G01305 [Penicillium arizonense]|uniref:C2H2-type domain-containing protein n=1 Tax=Penicillium arizonense TaxID=1835702 RepID=A0A1F5LAP8_PENAI|nr:hypothetical protein PENARI_c017G01305 [Penicillium arizonense]OGE50298.1 hypothetical protein PENARI_c017G01305 [Penicillium arizonense]
MSASTKSTRFRCALCPKEFSRRENLARHARIHKQQKLHRCPICGKEFTRSDVRQRHEEIHKAQRLPSATLVSQRQTASPKDHGLASSHTSDLLHETRSAETHNVAGSAGSSSLNARPLPENDAHYGSSNDWTPIHPFNMDIDQTSELEAQVQTEHPLGWTNQCPNNTFDDDLLRWMQEPCLFEDMCFGDDIMSVLLESGSMPPFNAAPILAMDIDRDQTTVDHHNQSSATFVDSGEKMSRPASPPNEASEEDKWPYRWDPGSQAITAANLAEVMTTECPCDEEFWHAPTANRWRTLLGSASVPPARTYASAVSPFLGPLSLGSTSYNTSFDSILRQTSFPSSISHNSWTRHLILTTIQVQIFELSQQISMVSEAALDTEIWQVPGTQEVNAPANSTFLTTLEPEIQPHYAYLVTRCLSSRHPGSTLSLSEQEVCKALAERKELISKMLAAWEQAYASVPAPDVAVYETSRYFHTSSQVYHRLGRLTLYVPIVDLQNALGKSGTSEISPVVDMMHKILTNHPEDVGSILTHCLEAIRDLRVQPTLSSGEPKSRMTEPPEIITCFLSEVFVWTLL